MRLTPVYVATKFFMEEFLVMLLDFFTIKIVPGRQHNGRHWYHEAVLETFVKPTNPYHEVLGRGWIRDSLERFKHFRNLRVQDGQGTAWTVWKDLHRKALGLISKLKEAVGFGRGS